jgi:hypothetical protein
MRRAKRHGAEMASLESAGDFHVVKLSSLFLRIMSLFCRFAADSDRPWQGEFNRCAPLISRCTIGQYKSLL